MQEKVQLFSPIKKRILQFIESLKISKREFYAKTGISRGTLESASGITEETITKFVATYKNISPLWLLYGTGEMTITDQVRSITIQPKDEMMMSCELCNQKDETIEVLKLLTRTQQKQVDLLTSRVEDLEAQLGQKKKAS